MIMIKNNKKFDWTKPLSTYGVMYQTFKELDQQWTKEDKELESDDKNSSSLNF